MRLGRIEEDVGSERFQHEPRICSLPSRGITAKLCKRATNRARPRIKPTRLQPLQRLSDCNHVAVINAFQKRDRPGLLLCIEIHTHGRPLYGINSDLSQLAFPLCHEFQQIRFSELHV